MTFAFGKYKLANDMIANVSCSGIIKKGEHKDKEILLGHIEDIPQLHAWFAGDGESIVNSKYSLVEFIRTEINYAKALTSLGLRKFGGRSDSSKKQVPSAYDDSTGVS